MTTVATLKTALLSLLADASDVAGWDDGVLTEAIRRGVWSYGNAAPAVESSVTVLANDTEVDLSTLDAAAIFTVAYPWSDGCTFNHYAIAFRMVGPTTIRADGYEFVAGEVLRVRYRKRYAVEDLDDATATTVDDGEIPALLLSCASHAYELRHRQLSRLPSAPKGEADAVLALADRYRDEFAAAMVATRAPGVISWGDIGL